MAICRPVSTGTNTAEMLEGTSRGVDTDTLLFLFRPFPAAVIASPTFHLFLFFSVVVKFSKEVWEAL